MKYMELFIKIRNEKLGNDVYDQNSPIGRIRDQEAFKELQKQYPQVRNFFDLEKAAA